MIKIKQHGGPRTPPGGRPRTGRGKIIQVIVSPILAEALRVEAERQGVSVSKFVKLLIQKYFQAHAGAIGE